MAKRIKGITIELDGDTKGLDKALSDVNKRSRDLQTELRDVDRLLKFNPGNTELIAQKQKLLANQVENTSNKLTQLKNAEKQVQDQFKKGIIKEEQYRAFQREIVETSSKLENLESKLQQTQKKVGSLGERMQETGNKMKSMGEKGKQVGSSLSTSLTAPLLGGLALVTKGTEEFREDLGRLETNAQTAGISTDVLKDSLVRLSGVTGETDSNVEALSNLLATGFNEEGLLQTMDALSGAVIKFPDTLKIEGLADGLQETIATGKAIGPFAEMLERLGFNLDTFNIGLEEAAKNGNEQNYILQNLANAGLTEVNDAYRKNNEELIESRESSMRFQQAMAELGATLTPIVTAITNAAQKLIDKFNGLSPTGQKVAIVIAGIAAAIGPLIFVVSSIISGIGGLITIAGTLGISLGALLGPIALVVAAIVGLIAIGVLLYKNWDTIKAKTIQIWGAIKNWLSRTVVNLVSAIMRKFYDLKNGITQRMRDNLTAIRSVWGRVMDFFRSINLRSMGMDIIRGLIGGIKAMAGRLVGSVKGVVNGAINGAKKLLGIASPSKVFKQFGVYSGEGLEIGLDSMKKSVQKAGEKMTSAALPDMPKQNNSMNPQQQVNVQTNPNITVYVGDQQIKDMMFDYVDGEQNIRHFKNSYMGGLTK